MTISFGSNIYSLRAERGLNTAANASAKLYQQLSSGLRINSASDDAAGLAIASSLRASSRVFSQGVRNINDATSLLNIADSTISNLSDIVLRIRELSEQAANGSFSARQRQVIDAEAQQLSQEFFRISRGAKFNNLGLLDGSLANGLRVQGGYGIDGGIQSSLGAFLGNGSFNTGTSYVSVNNDTKSVALGDINGDGNLDEVSGAVTSGNVGQLEVRLGNGDGSFGAYATYSSTTGSLSSVALSDVNADGILDVISSGVDGGAGVAHVRIGAGNGTFGTDTTYSMNPTSASSISTVDLNGDGNLDLLTAGGSGVNSTIAIRLGQGNGTFGSLTTYSASAGTTRSIAVGDVNRDGISDLITGGGGGANGAAAAIRLGQGNGTFGAAISYTMGPSTFISIQDIFLKDVNNDGNLDIIAGIDGASFSGIGIRLNQGDGTFGGLTTVANSNAFTNDFTLGDINGDGNIDVIGAGIGNDGAANIFTFLGNGNGTFRAGQTFHTPDGASSSAVSIGDLNGDGVLDLVTGGTDFTLNSTSVMLGATRDGINPLLPFSLSTKADALQSMSYLDRVLSNLAKQRGVIGAFQSRLQVAVSNLQSTNDNYLLSASRIIDTDVASDAASLTRIQIVQQSASAVLAQANQQPALSLLLLRNI